MDKSTKAFIEEIKKIREHFLAHKDSVKTEQHTKTAFIQPLLAALGYQLENPKEVVPEPIADIGAKKGEKIDYAIYLNGKPIIIIECKHWEYDLDRHRTQLIRYYPNIKAKFAILTNGKNYEFFADHDDLNIMDKKPFFEFDITKIKESQIKVLEKFRKSEFNLEKNINSSLERRQIAKIRENILDELKDPNEEFVKYLSRNILKKGEKITKVLLGQFTAFTKEAFEEVIDKKVEEQLNQKIVEARPKLKGAAKTQSSQPEPLNANIEADNGRVVTTEEELEGFYIVKGIIRQVAEAKRISYKDSQTYFSIILDDSSHKTVCRLHMNGKKKYLGTFDSNKVETKNEIRDPEDIFKYADDLIETAKRLSQGTK